MLNMGMTKEQVQKATKLTKEEVEEIAALLKNE